MTGVKMLLGLNTRVGTPTDWDNTEISSTVYGGANNSYIYLNADGSITLATDGSDNLTIIQPQSHWISPQAGMAKFEVQCVITSGSLDSTNAATGSGNWTALGGSNLYWKVHSNEPPPTNSQSCTMTFTIRRIGTTTPTYVSNPVVINATSFEGIPP